uniref:DUF4485 domain-containing protein n=1 Tax=Culex tarsalis TaxID=7177 RepID=A0A1Q3G036_CULTA
MYHHLHLTNGHHLDAAYKAALAVLKQQIVNLHDPTEVTICARWIRRFNEARPEEKSTRNRLIQLLIEQLADDNLSYPFIFLNQLDRPLQVPDLELLTRRKVAPIVATGEIGDILGNLKQLLSDAETLNLRTEEDLESLRESEFSGDGGGEQEMKYLRMLETEIRWVLSDQVPKLVESPDLKVVLSEELRKGDAEWIGACLERIRKVVESFRRCSEDSRSEETQTDHPELVVSSDIESFFERKFARLYADSILKDQARQMQHKSIEGLREIDRSQQYRKHLSKEFHPHC